MRVVRIAASPASRKKDASSWHEPNRIDRGGRGGSQRSAEDCHGRAVVVLCAPPRSSATSAVNALAVVVARPARDAHRGHRCPPRTKKRQATACTEPADGRRNRRIERCTAWNRSAVSDSSVLSVHAVVVSVPAPARHRQSKGTIPPHRRQPGGALEGLDAYGAMRWMFEQSKSVDLATGRVGARHPRRQRAVASVDSVHGIGLRMVARRQMADRHAGWRARAGRCGHRQRDPSPLSHDHLWLDQGTVEHEVVPALSAR